MKSAFITSILIALPFLPGCFSTDQGTVDVEPDAVDVKNDVRGDASVVKVNSKVDARTVPGTVQVAKGAFTISSNGNVYWVPNAINGTANFAPETVKIQLIINPDALHFEAKPGSFVLTVSEGAVKITADPTLFGKGASAEASRAIGAIENTFKSLIKTICVIAGILITALLIGCFVLHQLKSRAEARAIGAERALYAACQAGRDDGK